MRNKNSFTSQVKEELVSNAYPSDDRLRALLSAYIRINGSIVFRHKKTLLQLNTENAKIGKFIYQTINEIYQTIVDRMKAEKKILIKTYPNVGEFGNCLRVSIGEKKYMEQFVSALVELDK